MNKLTKAGIATAAGIALLMGGAGTLAYWNDSVGLAGDAIQTGHLVLSSNEDGAWTGGDIEYFVPGDTNTYTETLTVDALGDNLDVELDAQVPSAFLTGDFTTTTTFTLTGPGHTAGTVITPGSPVSLTEGEYTVAVQIVVNFDEDATGLMDQEIDLSDFTITATQV